MLGKLEGVADEVDEDLAEAGAIAADQGGDVAVEPVEEVEFLLGGAGCEQVEHAFDDFAEVEGDVLQLQLTGLDLGVVEDVVDDGQEGLAAGADGIDVVALGGGERGLVEEGGHADDAVHRGADLVAHGREEGALGLAGEVGFEGGLLGVADGVFELEVEFLGGGDGGAELGGLAFLLADVDEGGEELEVAEGVAEAAQGEHGPDGVAVGVLVAFFEGEGVDGAGVELLHHLALVVDVVGVGGGQFDVVAQALLGGDAGDLGVGGVDDEGGGFLAGDHPSDADGDGFEDKAEARLFACGGLLRVLEGGDVDEGGDDLLLVGRRIGEDIVAEGGPDDAAVGVDEAFFEGVVVDFAAAHALGHLVLARVVVGVGGLGE